MTLPDWVLNGTTYEDIGIVSDYSMGWNFNTREKARLTGGLSRIDIFGEKGRAGAVIVIVTSLFPSLNK